MAEVMAWQTFRIIDRMDNCNLPRPYLAGKRSKLILLTESFGDPGPFETSDGDRGRADVSLDNSLEGWENHVRDKEETKPGHGSSKPLGAQKVPRRLHQVLREPARPDPETKRGNKNQVLLN